MRSKTSCFNKTIFKKNLTRFAPVWCLYTLCLLLGLFLLGLVSHTIKRTNVVIAVAVGLAVIAWMSFLAPLHTYLTIVLGTLAIFMTGFVLSKIIK